MTEKLPPKIRGHSGTAKFQPPKFGGIATAPIGWACHMMHEDFGMILLQCSKFFRDLRMLATIFTLVCHNQDSVAIHINQSVHKLYIPHPSPVVSEFSFLPCDAWHSAKRSIAVVIRPSSVRPSVTFR